MAFKMKAGKEGPMKKNFPSAFEKDYVQTNNPLKKRIDKDKMACNKPRRSPKPQKKKVVKACEGGQEKIIHYGHTSYGHNYSAAARKSFRARHGCDKKKSKLTASYWACKDLWAGKGGSTKSNPKGVKGKY